MGLDISRITSESLKDIAYTLDKDNNGQLNDKEITIFKRKAKNHQDFSRTMDELYVTNPTKAKSQEVENTDTVEVKVDTTS